MGGMLILRILTSLSLQRVHNVQWGDSLALGMLSVCDGIADNAFKEGLEDTTRLFVDHCWINISPCTDVQNRKSKSVLAEIRLTPPRRARRRIAGLVMPWILSLKIFRWRLAPPFPRPFPPLPPADNALKIYQQAEVQMPSWLGVKGYSRPVMSREIK